MAKSKTKYQPLTIPNPQPRQSFYISTDQETKLFDEDIDKMASYIYGMYGFMVERTRKRTGDLILRVTGGDTCDNLVPFEDFDKTLSLLVIWAEHHHYETWLGWTNKAFKLHLIPEI